MNPYRIISLQVGYSTYLKLKELSQKTGRPCAEIIRAAIKDVIANKKNCGGKYE